jgi:hypothetical protein
LKEQQTSPRILLYITTVFSKTHNDYFSCYCWPQLMAKSKLLNRAEVIIFSSYMTLLDTSITETAQQLFASNPHFEIKYSKPKDLEELQQESEDQNQFQMGANLAVKLGVSNGWFASYDWVIRINPDVLIRDSSWICDTMHRASIDGIFVPCNEKQIHIDFFAVRKPNATVGPDEAFSNNGSMGGGKSSSQPIL